jgi:glycosyltransferase involved in cell wall biosynthesis
MQKKPVEVSIVIATFNSEKTLPMVLGALQKQTYPKEKIEILLIDGGSADKTLEIGKRYNCVIIPNPKTEPVYAKFLGYTHAKGKYLMYLDHDEVVENKNSIKNKVSLMAQNEQTKAVISTGYKKPASLPSINNYINEFGDPFSFFIYRLSKDAGFFLKQMKECYPIVQEDKDGVVFNLHTVSSLPIIELCAMGSMVDATYMKKAFPETLERQQLIPHFFYLLNSGKNYIAISKNDALIHYSVESMGKYKNKIKWRVKNNIFHTKRLGQAGFLGREAFQPKSEKIKKYLFLPYAFTFIAPIYDAVVLSITRRNLYYMVHVPLVVYTASLIIWYSLLKALGYSPQLKSYDNSKVVAS